MSLVVCKVCGKVTQGRSDKKFCSAKCSWTFHNWHRRDKHPPIITDEQLRQAQELVNNFLGTRK